jgi:hypothetical protein
MTKAEMLPLETIEAFFEARFGFADESLSDTRSLTHFDGFLYWQLFWCPKDGLLWIAADRELPVTPFPVLEIGGYYVDASVKSLIGVGTVLVLVPNGTLGPSKYLTITKTKDGHLSVATSLGNMQ